MKKIITLLVLILFTFGTALTATAGDMPITAGTTTSKTAQTTAKPGLAPVPQAKGPYPAGPIQKLERGFNNAVFGWTEIPKRIVDKTKESNPIRGVMLGVFQGTCKAFARTLSGVSEVATFPVGRYDRPRVLPDMPAAE